MNYVFPNFMKVMKILCYSAKLVAGLNVERNPDLAKRFAIVSSKISGARATLRLIDDIPMLQHTLEYGLGSKVQQQIYTKKRKKYRLSPTSYRFNDLLSTPNHMHISFDLLLTLHSLSLCSPLQESDTALSFIGVISNAIDHIYYPVEKLCWLAEHKAITLQDPDRWDTISSIFWVSSIYLNLMRQPSIRVN